MASSYSCTTIFFHTSGADLTERYLANTEQACGYLTRVGEAWVFVDAAATETADWVRQLDLATVMTDDTGIAISVLLVGEHWALGVAHDGRMGPVAVYLPDDPDVLKQLPQRLLAIESLLVDLFTDDVEAEQVDTLFGAVLEGVLPPEEAISEILAMLGCPPEWVRWSWYETIPEQLFLDPDLASRVTPLGEASLFWEE